MKTRDVVIARVYITESMHLLHDIMHYLKTDAQIRGVSVFRAVSGYGETGMHSASLLDVSLNLPLTIEFFDAEDKVALALDYLQTLIKPEHILFWHAQVNA